MPLFAKKKEFVIASSRIDKKYAPFVGDKEVPVQLVFGITQNNRMNAKDNLLTTCSVVAEIEDQKRPRTIAELTSTEADFLKPHKIVSATYKAGVLVVSYK